MAATDNACIPYYEGDRITCVADTAVVGKTFVAIAGDRAGDLIAIETATAAGRIFGVAAHDAAAGEDVVVLRGSSMVVPVTAGAAITAFAEVEVDDLGAAEPFTAGVAVGVCVTAAVDTEDAQIALY